MDAIGTAPSNRALSVLKVRVGRRTVMRRSA
jgi:hypothetical protein